MHVAFIPYGHSQWVKRFLRDVEAQKYILLCHSPDKKETKNLPMEGQLRVLPFGVYEHVFPKEYLNQVLTTLSFNREETYITKQIPKIPIINKNPLDLLRKALNLKKAPTEFDTKNKFFWTRDHVSIVPIGIREDKDLVEPKGDLKGWSHEGI